MFRTHFATALTFALCVSHSRTACAQDGLGLSWVRLDGAESCMSTAELASAVEARLGHAPFESPHDARVFVEGYVSPADQAWDVTLDVSDRAGQRLGRRRLHIAGVSCRDIDASVALVVAVTLSPIATLARNPPTLDPQLGARVDQLFGDEPSTLQPPPLRAAEATVPARDVRPPPIAAPHSARAEAPTRWALTASGQLGVGVLPGLAPAAALQLMVQLPPLWPIELGASVVAASTLRAPSEATAAVRFSAWTSELRVCPWTMPLALRVDVCGGAELGQLRSVPTGFVDHRAAASDWSASLHAAAVLRQPVVSNLHVRAAVLLAVPLIRRAYNYQSDSGAIDLLHRAAALAARLDLGLGLTF